MRAPRTARSVIGSSAAARTGHGHAAHRATGACRPRGRHGPSRRRTAGCRRCARGCSAHRRHRRPRARRWSRVSPSRARSRPASRMRSTPSRAAQSGSGPGRAAARTTNGCRAHPLDHEIDHPDARRIEPLEVVDDDDARPGRRRGGDRCTAPRPRPASRSHRRDRWGCQPASASQPENAASRAMAAIAPPIAPTRSSEQVVGEQKPASHGPGVDPMLVGDDLREEAGPAVRLVAGVRDVLGPRPGEAGSRAGVSTAWSRRDLPIPASPSIRIAAATARSGGPARAPHRCAPAPASGRPAGPGDAARNGIHGPIPASPRSACSSTAVDWPRSTTAPRGSVASRPRAARSGRLVEQDLAGSRHRLDARRGRDRLSGQPQVAVRVAGPPNRRRPRRWRGRCGRPAARRPRPLPGARTGSRAPRAPLGPRRRRGLAASRTPRTPRRR